MFIIVLVSGASFVGKTTIVKAIKERFGPPNVVCAGSLLTYATEAHREYTTMSLRGLPLHLNVQWAERLDIMAYYHAMCTVDPTCWARMCWDKDMQKRVYHQANVTTKQHTIVVLDDHQCSGESLLLETELHFSLVRRHGIAVYIMRVRVTADEVIRSCRGWSGADTAQEIAYYSELATTPQNYWTMVLENNKPEDIALCAARVYDELCTIMPPTN